jgi:hypothetical protein
MMRSPVSLNRTEPILIKRILDHRRKRDKACRPPPPLHSAVASIA